jgi:hypothetical protein
VVTPGRIGGARLLTTFKPAPGKKDRLAFDTECRGLGVRATAAGTRTFSRFSAAAEKRACSLIAEIVDVFHR